MRIAEQDERAAPEPQTPAGPHGAASFSRDWRVLAALLRAATRVGRLQVRLWMMKVKLSLLRIAILAAAAFLALFFIVAGGIFFYVGCYHVLTDVFHFNTAYACLIFAGLHLLAVALIGLAAMILVHRKRRPR